MIYLVRACNICLSQWSAYRSDLLSSYVPSLRVFCVHMSHLYFLVSLCGVASFNKSRPPSGRRQLPHHQLRFLWNLPTHMMLLNWNMHTLATYLDSFCLYLKHCDVYVIVMSCGAAEVAASTLSRRMVVSHPFMRCFCNHIINFEVICNFDNHPLSFDHVRCSASGHQKRPCAAHDVVPHMSNPLSFPHAVISWVSQR